jgi:ATP-dependent Clp protease ATP-binding subunit ClpA
MNMELDMKKKSTTLVSILGKISNRNALLIGEPGVGNLV